MKKQTKLVAVLSASALLALGMSVTSMAATSGWTEKDGVWQYLDKDGYAVVDEWKRSGSNYYWLDENGYMAVDALIEDGDSKYYVNSTGARLLNGWAQVENTNSWMNGNNNQELDSVWYYFGSTGKAQIGKKTINGKTYIFDETGEMFSGWTEYKEKTYYLGESNEGWACTGWMYLELHADYANDDRYDSEQGWFYFKASGEMRKADKDGATVRAYIGGAYYGFDHNGVMVEGWVPSDESTNVNASYYGSESGAQKSGWIQAYRNESEGKEGDLYWFYLNSKGKPFNIGGFYSDDSKEGTESLGIAQLYESGAVSGDAVEQVAAKVISTKTYLFDNTGEMMTGVYKFVGDNDAKRVGGSGNLVKGKIYSFNKSGGSVNGQMETGKTTISYDGENYYYYFQKNGQAHTNVIVDNCLYRDNGTRLNAEESREVITLTGEDFVFPIKVSNNSKIELQENDKIIVSSSGSIRKTGSITIDGQKYTIKDYKATEVVDTK